jgi:hypothetical protein
MGIMPCVCCIALSYLVIARATAPTAGGILTHTLGLVYRGLLCIELLTGGHHVSKVVVVHHG